MVPAELLSINGQIRVKKFSTALLLVSNLKLACLSAVTDDLSRTWLLRKACCSPSCCLWTKLDVISDSCCTPCTLLSVLS